MRTARSRSNTFDPKIPDREPALQLTSRVRQKHFLNDINLCGMDGLLAREAEFAALLAFLTEDFGVLEIHTNLNIHHRHELSWQPYSV